MNEITIFRAKFCN